MNVHTKLRVVIDSNVWISGLVFGGSPGKVLELFIKGSLLVIVSEELVRELRRNVTKKFPRYAGQLDLLEASILKDATVVSLGAETVTASRDPDDNKVIEAALIGECHYIISGDKDLLAIGKYRGIRIVTPAAFLKREKFS